MAAVEDGIDVRGLVPEQSRVTECAVVARVETPSGRAHTTVLYPTGNVTAAKLTRLLAGTFDQELLRAARDEVERRRAF